MQTKNTSKPLSYLDFLEDLSSGNTCGVFIDDTGSPGLKDTPPNLHPERKTWVAVIVPPSVMPEVLHQFKGVIEELHAQFGVDEFQFADIYNGRNQFKSVEIKARLALFEFMAIVFSDYGLPILVQTFDPETLAHTRSRVPFDAVDTGPFFDLARTQDAALFFLLLQVQSFMRGMPKYPEIKARVFIDEGFKNSGIALKLPWFVKEFADGLICFATSSSIIPIQLADFAAFLLNRMQLIGGRERRSLIDLRLAQISSVIAPHYVNLDKKFVFPKQQGSFISLAEARPFGPHQSDNRTHC